jgi:hypothetical protein
VTTPLPASASTWKCDAGHVSWRSGAWNHAPYAPALEPVTKTWSGFRKCSRAHFSTTRAFWKPRCSMWTGVADRCS